MPGGDGTGPAGMGPMTGRAGGYCAGYQMPGYMNPIPGRCAAAGGAWGTAPYYAGAAYGYPYGPVGYGAPWGYDYGMAPRFGWGWGRGRGFGRGWGRGFGRGFLLRRGYGGQVGRARFAGAYFGW